MRRLIGRAGCFCVALAVGSVAFAADPAEVLKTLRVPEGFTVELVATTPLVEHPVMAGFDDRGRLFVADNAGLKVRDFHVNIKGDMPDGSRYHALDPDIYWWAHATFTWEFFRARELYFPRRLSGAQREQRGVARKRDVDGVGAVAVHDGGHLVGATGTAGTALAASGTRDRLVRDLA